MKSPLRNAPTALALAAVMTLSACSAIRPDALSPAQLQATNQADAQAARTGVTPIEGPLTVEEAMARALKHPKFDS